MTFDHAVEDPVRPAPLVQSSTAAAAANTIGIPSSSRMEQLLNKYVNDNQETTMSKTPEKKNQSVVKAQQQAAVTPSLDAIKSFCRPWNYEDFRLRLGSFSQTYNWFAKPAYLSPIEAARRGWINTSLNTLHCHVCETDLIHDEDQLNGDQSQDKDILSAHHQACCGWRSNVCSSSFCLPPPLCRQGEGGEETAIQEEANTQLRHRFHALYHMLCGQGQQSSLSLRLDLSSMREALKKGEDTRSLLTVSALSALMPSEGVDSPTIAAAIGEIQQQLLLLSSDHDHQRSEDIKQDLSALTIAFCLVIAGWEKSKAQASSVHCSLCSRTVNVIANDIKSSMDPLSQHRPHCPHVITDQATSGKDDDSSGDSSKEKSVGGGGGWIRLLSSAFSRHNHSHSRSHTYSRRQTGLKRKRQSQSAGGEGTGLSTATAAAAATGEGDEEQQVIEDMMTDDEEIVEIDPASAFKRVRGALSL